MNFKLYAIIFATLLGLLSICGLGVQWYIKAQINKGVESELALRALEKQNEAIEKNAIWQDEIDAHNESQNERYDELNDKYSKALSKNSALQRQKSSCEAELAQIKELLGVFYDTNSSK